MNWLWARLRLRLLPALLTALGVALLANGVMTYTTAVEPAPSPRVPPTFEPIPTISRGIDLPGGGGVAQPTFPADRVATRVVVRRLGIDLPVMLQVGEQYGVFPLCDVAMYLPQLGQPGEGRATYLYAHAREGMFLPLLTQSESNDGRRMLGMTVEVYTSDDWRYLYTITEVRRHTRDLRDALETTTERVWLQTSEGPEGTVPKLQVVGDFLSAEKTDPKAAHPQARPRICT